MAVFKNKILKKSYLLTDDLFLYRGEKIFFQISRFYYHFFLSFFYHKLKSFS